MAARKNPTRFKCFTAALVLVAVFLWVGATAITSQRTPPTVTPQDPQGNSNRDPAAPDLGSRESEMRAKMILKDEKKRYDEHLERAREAAQLASQLFDTYQAKQEFNAEDSKKLERLEKLAKRIRNEAGGSDTDPDVKDLPANFPAAVKRLPEMAADLRKLVEKTPRRVIAANVIEEANKLIGLIQYMRSSRR
jgi:hypothetical protein